jgi:NAD(P)H-hydrate epimerase
MNYKQSSSDTQATKTQANKRADRYSYVRYCYPRETIRTLDKLMVQQGVVENSYQLMERAARALLDFINRKYSDIKHITIICGAGNNAGDGYVLARLARMQKPEPAYAVQVVSLIDAKKLGGDASRAYHDWLECERQVDSLDEARFDITGLIVDALIGTGLDRLLDGQWADAVQRINNTNVPVLSVDIPSGLDANTGSVQGIAVKADHTITFIAQKQGMNIGEARAYCGEVSFASLGVPEELYQQVEHTAVLLEWCDLVKYFPARSPASSKAEHGHLLIIGGDLGMAGACCIAGEAALRTGVGLVSIAPHPENVTAITSNRPELMVHGIETADDLVPLLKRATTIAIGPGLGTRQWGIELLAKIIAILENPELFNQSNTPYQCVIDADALNIIAKNNWVIDNNNVIYTPHFVEASRLLTYESQVTDSKTDRFAMINALTQHYGGIFILKGAGTMISQQHDINICPYGNEGMASAGMGDCLTGIIGALLAQKISLANAAAFGVCLHAKAGDLAAKEGKNGMLVSDLFPAIRSLINATP